MADIASELNRIQSEEVNPRAPVSQALVSRLGGTMNWILDHVIVPPGSMIDFAGTAAPSGWLLCNGAAVSQTTYADLYAAIGSTWNTGGEGAGNFRLPDFTGRYARGSGGGKSTGEYLAAALPSHTHTVDGAANTLQNPGAGSGGAQASTVTTSSGGAVGDGTEVRPASAVVSKIIKT